MKNLKISTKLILLVVVMSLILAFIGLYSVENLKKTNQSLETVYNDRVVPLNQLKNVSDMYAVNIVDATHKIRNENINWLTGKVRIEKAKEEIAANWNAYMATKIVGDEQKLSKEAQHLMNRANESIMILEDIIQRKDTVELEKYIRNDLYENIDPITAKISELMEFQLTIAKEEYENGQVLYLSTRNSSYLFSIIGIVIGVLVSLLIIRNIKKAIKEANKVAIELSKGNLLIDIEIMSKDEMGDLLNNLKNMVQKMKEVISHVHEAADNIASASMQMSSTSQQMSQGSSEQASSAEEVSTSMEEMAANIQHNTDNARQTETIAHKASQDISKGSESVNRTVDSMKIIAERISIINEIAGKTDLLAINAAIEAARAGEHGKGFAVVASQVRKLAENSQIAAKEIDEVSRSSVSIATESGSLLQQIVPDIQKTSKLVQEIAASNIEQNSGVDQINTAVQQLNQVTQQNAASAEEMATSAEELSGQAEQLKDAVAFFKVDDEFYSKTKNRNKKHKTSKYYAMHEKSHSENKRKANGDDSSGVNIDMSDEYPDEEFEKY